MSKEADNEIISVSAYLDRLNATLKTERARVVGEVTGVQEYPGRSYLYFSIKDSKDQSTAKCFMWKNDYRISGVTLSEGMEVVITTYPSIYKPNGGLTLQVELVELVGEGVLKIQYDALRKKLEAEGLFSDMRKRAILDYPRKVGVITSKAGAVINDFLTNIGKFGFEIIFVDSKVEGQDAIKDLLSAVRTLKKKELDVLVIMRGGGSLESFSAFNNEMFIREVATFPVPVLTGIGHDKDLPLVSLVSDKNVSTPTATAHILNRSWQELLQKLQMNEQKIMYGFESRLKEKKFFLENSERIIEKKFVGLFERFRVHREAIARSVHRLENSIIREKEKMEGVSKELQRNFTSLLVLARQKLSRYEQGIEVYNPKRQLARGYSIVRSGGKIVRTVSDVKKGDELDIMVSDGIIETQII